MLVAALCAVNACASGARLAPAVQERGWRSYLGNAAREGESADAPGGDPQPVWRVDIGRGVRGAPALAEDVIAISQVDRHVVLLDRATGEVLWRSRLPATLGAGPLLADDRVFVATQEDGGGVYALRLSTGRRIWSLDVGNVVAPLALEERALYAATDRGVVVRLDPVTGARLWRTVLGAPVYAAPLPVQGSVAIATTGDSLYLLEADNGSVRARRATPGSVLAAPAYSGGLIVVGTMDGWLVAYDAGTLAPRWHLRTDGPLVGHVAIRGRTAWAATARGTVWAVPLDSGAVAARSFATGMVLRSGPAVTADGVLLAGASGELARFTATGRRTWSARLDGPLSEPVIVYERSLLAVSDLGDVVLFR